METFECIFDQYIIRKLNFIAGEDRIFQYLDRLKVYCSLNENVLSLFFRITLFKFVPLFFLIELIYLYNGILTLNGILSLIEKMSLQRGPYIKFECQSARCW